jgi:anti-sigma-K factor RskA
VDVHDLTAAYALDALEPDEAKAYEEHLAQCEECREQLAELNASVGALAFGAVAPEPPPRLRAAILDAAAAERSNVVPLPQRRWTPRVLAVAAAAAACVAVGFAVSALHSGGKPVVTATVVVAPDRTATLQVTGLAAPPHGKTYEAWIIPNGRAPRPAGTFAGDNLALRGKLPPHATVAVTLEPAGGDSAPTTAPVVVAPT